MKSEIIANAIRNIDDDIVKEAAGHTADNAVSKSSSRPRSSGSIFRTVASAVAAVVLIAGGIVTGIVLGSRGRNSGSLSGTGTAAPGTVTEAPDPEPEVSPYQKTLFLVDVSNYKLTFEADCAALNAEISCGGPFYACTGRPADSTHTPTAMIDILNHKNIILAVNPSEISFTVRLSKSAQTQGDDFCYDFNIYEAQHHVAVIDCLSGIQLGTVAVNDSELEAIINAYSPTLETILKTNLSDTAALFYLDQNDYSELSGSPGQYGVAVDPSGLMDISSLSGSVAAAIGSMHVFETDDKSVTAVDNWLATFVFITAGGDSVAVVLYSGPYLAVIEGEGKDNTTPRLFRISRQAMSAFEGVLSNK